MTGVQTCALPIYGRKLKRAKVKGNSDIKKKTSTSIFYFCFVFCFLFFYNISAIVLIPSFAYYE